MESGGRIKEWTDSLRRQRTRNKMPEGKGHKDETRGRTARLRDQENVGGGIGRGREGDLAPLQKIIPRAMLEVGSFVLCRAAVRVAARTAGAWHQAQASRPSPFLGLTGAHLDGSPLEPTLVERRGGPCLVEHCTALCQTASTQQGEAQGRRYRGGKGLFGRRRRRTVLLWVGMNECCVCSVGCAHQE